MRLKSREGFASTPRCFAALPTRLRHVGVRFGLRPTLTAGVSVHIIVNKCLIVPVF